MSDHSLNIAVEKKQVKEVVQYIKTFIWSEKAFNNTFINLFHSILPILGNITNEWPLQ